MCVYVYVRVCTCEPERALAVGGALAVVREGTEVFAGVLVVARVAARVAEVPAAGRLDGVDESCADPVAHLLGGDLAAGAVADVREEAAGDHLEGGGLGAHGRLLARTLRLLAGLGEAPWQLV